ncbi:MAG TPA: ATP-binding protein, partial [Candidatus Omnitrophica bacterium]|nr:ATP-binding protein [Candidatus Omnitrophota bacterium]
MQRVYEAIGYPRDSFDKLLVVLDGIEALFETQILFIKGKPNKEDTDIRAFLGECKWQIEARVNKESVESKVGISIESPEDTSSDLIAPIDKILMSRLLGELTKDSQRIGNIRGIKLINVKIKVLPGSDGKTAKIIYEDDCGGLSQEELSKGALLDTENRGKQKIFYIDYSTKKGGETALPGHERVSGQKGGGIGLSEAWYIIKDHGGTINVESIKDKGIRFTITLPLKYQEASAEAGAEKSMPKRDFRQEMPEEYALFDLGSSAEQISLSINSMDRFFGNIAKADMRRIVQHSREKTEIFESPIIENAKKAAEEFLKENKERLFKDSDAASLKDYEIEVYQIEPPLEKFRGVFFDKGKAVYSFSLLEDNKIKVFVNHLFADYFLKEDYMGYTRAQTEALLAAMLVCEAGRQLAGDEAEAKEFFYQFLLAGHINPLKLEMMIFDITLDYIEKILGVNLDRPQFLSGLYYILRLRNKKGSDWLNALHRMVKKVTESKNKFARELWSRIFIDKIKAVLFKNAVYKGRKGVLSEVFSYKSAKDLPEGLLSVQEEDELLGALSESEEVKLLNYIKTLEDTGSGKEVLPIRARKGQERKAEAEAAGLIAAKFRMADNEYTACLLDALKKGLTTQEHILQAIDEANLAAIDLVKDGLADEQTVKRIAYDLIKRHLIKILTPKENKLNYSDKDDAEIAWRIIEILKKRA